MQYTANYNLITVEGTDVVNPLVQMNPNFTDIDAAMFANKQAVIGTASEITSGTVHSITRANPDSNYFRFTATSNWTAGDSMSVDGVNVSVFLTDGTLPGTGSYVINSEVFGIIAGTRVTLYLTNPITTLPADHVTFDPTGSSLTSTNAEDAIKEAADRPGYADFSTAQSAFTVDVTTTPTTLYTVPRNCYMRITCISAAAYNANIVRCSINGNIVASSRGGENDIFIPVRQGDIVSGYADLNTDSRITGTLFDFA